MRFKYVSGVCLAVCVFIWLGAPFPLFQDHLAQMQGPDSAREMLRAPYLPAVLILTAFFLCLTYMRRIKWLSLKSLIPGFLLGVGLLIQSRLSRTHSLPWRQFAHASSVALGLLGAGVITDAYYSLKEKRLARFKLKEALLAVGVVALAYLTDQLLNSDLLPQPALQPSGWQMHLTEILKTLCMASVGAALFLPFGHTTRWDKLLGIVVCACLLLSLIEHYLLGGQLLARIPWTAYLLGGRETDFYPYLLGIMAFTGFFALFPRKGFYRKAPGQPEPGKGFRAP